MWHKLFEDSSLFEVIQRFDDDTARAAQAARCPHCCGPLDGAAFRRKPRGLPACAEGDSRRPSFCCRRDGCRRRVTPPQLVFLGRRVYVSVVVVLVAALLNGETPARVGELSRRTGAAPRTIRRWLVWWRQEFPLSPAWQRLRGRLVAAIDVAMLPSSLLLAAASLTQVDGLVAVLKLVTLP